MIRKTLLMLTVFVFLLTISNIGAANFHPTETAKTFYLALGNKDYAVCWQLLSSQSKLQVVHSLRQSWVKAGITVNEQTAFDWLDKDYKKVRTTFFASYHKNLLNKLRITNYQLKTAQARLIKGKETPETVDVEITFARYKTTRKIFKEDGKWKIKVF